MHYSARCTRYLQGSCRQGNVTSNGIILRGKYMVLNKLMFLATIHLRLAFADLLLVHCTGPGTGTGTGLETGLGMMGLRILLCTVHTTQGQGKGTGTIGFHTHFPVLGPGPVPIPGPLQCE